MNHRPTVCSAQWADLNLLERIAIAFYLVAAYLVAAIGFFALLYLGFLAAVLEWRPGAYLVVVGLTVYFLGRHFALGVFARRDGDLADLTQRERIYLVAGVVSFLLLILGIYAGLLGWRGGAYLAVGGLSGHLVGHLVVGLSVYRRVMARPWPEVPAPNDEEW
jgi:hypothetical protein